MRTFSLAFGAALAALTVSTAGAASAQTAPMLIAANATPDAQLVFGRDIAGEGGLLQQVQFFWGGRNYCWYDGGWRGAGFYWCGYAWRRGYGWGGPVGWHGWARGGYRGGYHGSYHGGFHGGHHSSHHGEGSHGDGHSGGGHSGGSHSEGGHSGGHGDDHHH